MAVVAVWCEVLEARFAGLGKHAMDDLSRSSPGRTGHGFTVLTYIAEEPEEYNGASSDHSWEGVVR